MPEGIDFYKTDGSREFIICHYWFVHETNFKFQPEVCNFCSDLMQKAKNINDVAVVSVKGNNYKFIFGI